MRLGCGVRRGECERRFATRYRPEEAVSLSEEKERYKEWVAKEVDSSHTLKLFAPKEKIFLEDSPPLVVVIVIHISSVDCCCCYHYRISNHNQYRKV